LATAKENPTKGVKVPDVKMFVRKSMHLHRDFWRDMRTLVAVQMACEECSVTPAEIDLLVVRTESPSATGLKLPVVLCSGSDILIEVSGYAYPSRMSNRDTRIKNIAEGVKQMLGDRYKVSITFLPVQDGCWCSA
jgi:hypothetical protein